MNKFFSMTIIYIYKSLDSNRKINFKHRIELTGSNKFMKKRMTMGRLARCRLNVDESRIWHMDMANTRRLSFSLGFL